MDLSNYINSSATTAEDDKELQDIKQAYKNFQQDDPELCKQLRMLGIGEVMIVKVIEKFQITQVYNIIFKENPYRLMEVEGIGFMKADNVAIQLGVQSEDPRRQRALIQHVLEQNKNFGNVYLPATILEKECKKQNVHMFQERLNEMINNHEVILEENRIYLAKLYVAECETADMLKDLITGVSTYSEEKEDMPF